jgi:hypothetical protein
MIRYNVFWKISPWLVCSGLVLIAAYLNLFVGLTYFNLAGLDYVLKSFVWLSGGSLLFVFLIGKLYLFKRDAVSNAKNFLYVILQVFVSAGLTSILTVMMQILIHYPSALSSMVYYVWLGIVGLFLTYNFELGLMGLSLLFDDKKY